MACTSVQCEAELMIADTIQYKILSENEQVYYLHSRTINYIADYGI